jgi:uncharacterized SAM-binding protein YcdF (DUF218 family)
MFFILSKLFIFFIQPFSWVLISLAFYLFLKKAKWKKVAKITLISCLIFFSNTFIFLEFERMWEIHGTPIEKVKKKYEIGIVLSGMFEYNNDLKNLSTRRGSDRIWQALNLYHKKKIKKLLITGGSGYVSDRGLIEAVQLKEVLVHWGIPEKDIICETKSKNTYENAVETRKLLDRSYPHIKSCLLITSGQHMRRSRAIFEKQGFGKIDCFSTDLYTGPKRHYYWDQYFVPSSETLDDWNGLIKEWVGYMTYAVMGYL